MTALAQIVRRGAARAGRMPEPGDRCGMCAAPVQDRHRHLVDLRTDELLCACYPCSVLFDRPAAGGDRFRLVPDRRVRLQGMAPSDLGVPVGLAFFVSRRDGRVDARYPSPAGATRWEVHTGAWAKAAAACPALDELAPDVEALLVWTRSGQAGEAWIVPVDDCYRLVAIVRGAWEGISGGDRVWAEVDRFFEEIRRSDERNKGR